MKSLTVEKDCCRNHHLGGPTCMTGQTWVYYSLKDGRMSHITQIEGREEDWRILFFYFPVNQVQAVLCLSQLLPYPVISILLPSPCSCVPLSLTKRDMLTFGKNSCPILPSIFPFLAETMKGEGGSTPVCSWRSSTFPVSVPYKRCYFSCHVCWGTTFGLFFLQKGRKANLEKYLSHVISNDLAVVPGIGLLTVSRRRVGETQLQPTRRKREKDLNLPWAWLALPSFRLHL